MMASFPPDFPVLSDFIIETEGEVKEKKADIHVEKTDFPC